MRRNFEALLTMMVLSSLLPSVSDARSLRDALIPPAAADAAFIEAAIRSIRPLGSAVASQVANQIPALTTSAGFTYEYNHDHDVFERSTKTFGPLFSERAITIGRGKLNIGAFYSWIHFDTFNGKDISHLRSRVEFARLPEAPDEKVFAGIFDSSGFLTQAELRLNLEAQLFEVGVTYGLLDNVDLNVGLPVLRTYARSGLTFVIPDPRCVSAGIQQCVDVVNGIDPGPDVTDRFPPNGFLRDDGFFEVPESAARDSSLGIGDIHLRAKYLALRRPVDLAGLLDLGVPTGDVDDFQGTGDTTLRTSLIASRDLFDRLEVHSQAGIEFTINDVERSQARYAIGVTGQIFSFAALTVDFLGRSEFNPQGRIKDTGRLPEVEDGTFVQTFDELVTAETGTGRGVFVDIERNDVLDLAVGMKLSVSEQAIVFANFLVPLNDDGLRSDFVPTLGTEVSF